MEKRGRRVAFFFLFNEKFWQTAAGLKLWIMYVFIVYVLLLSQSC